MSLKRLRVTVASVIALPGIALASTGALPRASTAFCLFEMPSPSGKRVWLNLGIVQYIEQRPGELAIYYGGGRFGAGHEARIPMRSAEETHAFMERMLVTAARCAGK